MSKDAPKYIRKHKEKKKKLKNNSIYKIHAILFFLQNNMSRVKVMSVISLPYTW